MTDEPELPGVADPLLEQRAELKKVMDTLRCVMLMEPVAQRMDDIPMAGPVKRTILLGQLISEVGQNNPRLHEMIVANDVLRTLHGHAVRRKSGEIAAPPAFSADIAAPAPRGG